MAKKKKQHFVPQFYLKNYSFQNDSRSIGICALDSGRYIQRGNLRNQAYSDYFYGENAVLENAFALLEGSVSSILSQIISDRKIPPRESREYFHLLTFIISLSQRTRYAADAVNEMANQMLKIAYKDDSRINKYFDKFNIVTKDAPNLALSALDRSLLVSLDLGYKILINDTSHMFITSDNPVIKHNHYLRRIDPIKSYIGFANKGLQIILSLNPVTCLIFYDQDVYGVGNKKESIITVSNHEDVDEINRFIRISADKVLYFDHNVNETYIRKIINDSKGFRRKSRVVTHEYEVPSSDLDTQRSIIHVHPNIIRKDLRLSFIRILKKARKSYPKETSELFRDPELVNYLLDSGKSR